MPKRLRHFYLPLFTLLFFVINLNAYATSKDEAFSPIAISIKKALSQNEYQRAFSIAQNSFIHFGGEPEFDYLYARSAIEVAKYYEAIFALERVLVIWPDHIPSHYLLGLTYTKQKNYEKAKVILSGLLNVPVDPEIRTKIIGFLSIVDDKLRRQTQNFEQLVSLEFGHDSNVNSGTLDDRIMIAGIPFLLDQSSQEKADKFMRKRYRFKGEWQQTQYDSWDLWVNLSDQQHQDSAEFDRYQGNIRFGYQSKKDRFMYSAGGQFGVLALDSNSYQQDYGFYSTFQYYFSSPWFASLNAVAFSQNNARDPNLDSRIYTLQSGIGYVNRNWLFRVDAGHTWQPARYHDGEHFARNYYFMTGTVLCRLHEKHSLDLKIQYRNIAHRADHPFFLAARDEELTSVKGGWRFQLNDAWSTNISVSYYDKHSSISIYSYERTEWSTGVHYEF
jgi:hypothetical protein